MHRIILLAAALVLVGAGAARADNITDSQLDVNYQITTTADTGNTYDVTVVVDATGFNSGTGDLTSIALAFAGNVTSVSLESVTGGTSGWSTLLEEGLNSGGCTSSQTNFWCTQNNSSTLGVPAAGTYTFVFDVTTSSGTPGWDDIKVGYSNETTGANLGLTSIEVSPEGVTTPTPEPGTIGLMGAGLLALGGLIRRRVHNS